MSTLPSPDWFVLNLFSCPNCNGTLHAKPQAGVLENVYCTGCDLACVFKSFIEKPESTLLTLPKREFEALVASKALLPPLMLHFKWEENGIAYEEVQFFPFIAHRFLGENGPQVVSLSAGEPSPASLFKLIADLPSLTLYSQPSDEEFAQIASAWDSISTSRIQSRFYVGFGRASRILDAAIEIRRKKGIIDDFSDSEDEDAFGLGDSDELR